MPHCLLQVFVIDWIKLCHGIGVGYKQTHGQHTCTWYVGTGGLVSLSAVANRARALRRRTALTSSVLN